MADLMMVAWKVYGIKLMTRSFFATSASRAFSSVTSREMGLAFLTPSEASLYFRGFCKLNYVSAIATESIDVCNLSTETSVTENVKVDRATKPAPSIRTFLNNCYRNSRY